MSKIAIAAGAALACMASAPAYAGDAANPVSAKIAETYRIASMRVVVEGAEAPGDHDEAAMTLADAAFADFAAQHGGLAEETAGELYLQHRLARELEAVAAGFSGARDAALVVEVARLKAGSRVPENFASTGKRVDTVSALYFTVGLTDAATGEAIVSMRAPARVAPQARRHAGPLAEINDVAAEAGADIAAIFSAPVLDKAVAKRLVAPTLIVAE